MKRLWQRFLRLCRESEIRLSASELRLEAIRSGDLLQVGPRLFRVTGRLAGAAGLELVAASEGRARRARLARAASDPLRPWVLEERDARTFLASCDLLHFPGSTMSP